MLTFLRIIAVVRGTVTTPIPIRLPPHGIAVLESHHAPGFAAPLLRHDFAKLILVIGGCGVLRSGRERLRLEPDVLLHVPAQTPHSLADEPGCPVSLYAVCFWPPPRRLPLARWRLGAQALSTRSDFREMVFEQTARREGWELVLQSRLRDLIVRALRRDRPAPVVFTKGQDSAERVATYALQLETRFYAASSLDDAAHSVGLSRRRFTQLFRAVTGQSWHARVQELRLRHARQLLSATDKSVINVAFECGYDDVSHFHRLFKRSVGVSPVAYRSRALRDGRPQLHRRE